MRRLPWEAAASYPPEAVILDWTARAPSSDPV
jgi:hypothetical protein